MKPQRLTKGRYKPGGGIVAAIVTPHASGR